MESVPKSGRYSRAQIVGRDCPPQYRTFDTRTEAEAWTRALESEMDRGIFASRVESEKTALTEALQRYEREISVGKVHPQQDYQRVRNWLRQDLAHYFLASIRRAGLRLVPRRQAGTRTGAKHRAARTSPGEPSLRNRAQGVGHGGTHNPLKNIRKPSGSHELGCRLRTGETLALAPAESEN